MGNNHKMIWSDLSQQFVCKGCGVSSSRGRYISEECVAPSKHDDPRPGKIISIPGTPPPRYVVRIGEVRVECWTSGYAVEIIRELMRELDPAKGDV